MGGLLTRAIGGALAGFGDAAINDAKQRREDAVAALKRSQDVEDRDAGFAHQDANLITTEEGANARAALGQEGENARLGITEAGANSRNAATIAAENKRNAATLGNEGGLLQGTQQDDAGNTYGITRSGKKIDLGIKNNKDAAKDDQILNRINDIYSTTTIDPDSQKPIKSVDRNAAAAALTQMGRSDLAAIYTGGGNTIKAPPPAAANLLKQHPEMRKDFDTKYGAGAAARVLGN